MIAMSQHFLLAAGARTLSLSAVPRMTQKEAEAAFIKVRWPKTDGMPTCPHCECLTVYPCRRATGALRWRCKATSASQGNIVRGLQDAASELPRGDCHLLQRGQGQVVARLVPRSDSFSSGPSITAARSIHEFRNSDAGAPGFSVAVAA
jgi:hypothetical protein